MIKVKCEWWVGLAVGTSRHKCVTALNGDICFLIPKKSGVPGLGLEVAEAPVSCMGAVWWPGCPPQ